MSIEGLIIRKDEAFLERSMIFCDSVDQMYVKVVYLVLSFYEIYAFWGDSLNCKSYPC